MANLRIGADILSSKSLSSNVGLASVGYQINGKGFLISPEKRNKWIDDDPNVSSLLKLWMNGMGLQRQRAPMFAIDLWPHTEEEAKKNFPIIYQHLLDYVWPDRSENARRAVRERWWLFEECRSTFRPAIKQIDKVIVTTLTSANRVFSMLDTNTVCDSTTVMFALDETHFLSVLTCRIHGVWFEANAASLGGFVGNIRYNKTRCFDPFPFPDLTDPQKKTLRALGEELDAHRKRQQAAHPKLTLTNMYNVLEKLRAGEAIEGKDKEIYDQGLIGILRDLHDQIDAAVADAYGWPVDLSDEEILMRLVDLNKERAAEEASGHIRWLRPDYQNPTGAKVEKGKTTDMDLGVVAKVEKAAWPKGLPDQIAAVREALVEMGEASPEQIARRFARARTTAVQPLLESLAALGQADKTDDGKYAA
ncbi:type IIL restriction-modification enzyme MmeI [Pseudophaeobacter flagellatus]|uniref:type IIL restriction-modification enzyme MmeI n=1 Tax=Pseudophaeobacter flagellatus TaxID=2899119 RepID=UPI001E3689EF|nr:type IIL restriction-modification enzyme MmeI [Pseudophaeobacter flagellatus]